MAITIAVSGKGGSGKTTVAALIVRLLAEGGRGPVLAVDADPNATLGLALGVEPEVTVGEIRDRTLERTLPGSDTDRERAFELALNQAVAEARGFDLLAMGHTEGPKCYCAVNNLLRRYVDRVATDYRFIVLDNEAGMEHLSRRTTDEVDHLIVVAEPTAAGALTARRILALVERLPVTVRARRVLWNKTTSGRRPPESASDLPTAGEAPLDEAVEAAGDAGRTVFDLDPGGPAPRAVAAMLAEMGLIE